MPALVKLWMSESTHLMLALCAIYDNWHIVTLPKNFEVRKFFASNCVDPRGSTHQLGKREKLGYDTVTNVGQGRLELVVTAEVAAYYKRTEQTIRAWAREFSGYLSPTANPGGGKGRNYTYEDLRVIALIADMKDENATYEDIHASLAAGQRGDPPNMSVDDLKVLRATEGEKRAGVEIQALQQHIIDIQVRMRQAEARAEAAETKAIQLGQDKAALTAEAGIIKAELERAREELKAAQEANMRLSREVGTAHGQAYIDGYRAGLNEGREMQENTQTSGKESPT
jgi:DNA-binding transcriptional MerR regulator